MVSEADAAALLEEGIRYYETKDEALLPKAFDCFTAAAAQGSTDAVYYLGVMSYNGFATEQSYENAMKCFMEAAAAGN